MFNARDLLGQVMQAGMTGTTADRMRHALGRARSAAPTIRSRSCSDKAGRPAA